MYINHSFIRDNLLHEISSSKAMTAFAWVLKKHTFTSYSLYMAGEAVVGVARVGLLLPDAVLLEHA